MFKTMTRKRSDPLIFALRKAIMKVHYGFALSKEELDILDSYFREGVDILLPDEFATLRSDPCNFSRGVVVIKREDEILTVSDIDKMGTEVMLFVDVKYRVGVRCT